LNIIFLLKETLEKSLKKNSDNSLTYILCKN
jgi:hypothetical protein